MPWKVKSICIERDCPEFAWRYGRCELHAQKYIEEYRARNPDKPRPSAARRGYDQKWRRIRAAFLKKHPDCEWPGGCNERATEVDHIQPLEQGGTNDWDNLRAFCKPHHSRKTAIFDGGFGNRIFDHEG